MLKGIGIDIIEIDRIKQAVEAFGQKFLKKIYTSFELRYCTALNKLKYPELAARFAAKEAYGKAMGTGVRGLRWREIEVRNNKAGKPELIVKGNKKSRAHLTLSHSRDYAVASVCIEG